MSQVRVWVNGSRVGPDERALSAIDHGVTVGDGAFETLKVVQGELFAPRRHRERLDRSLAGLGLPGADHGYVAEGIAAVLAEPLELGRLRYTVTGGAGPAGSDRGNSPLTYIVTASPTPPPAASSRVHLVAFTRNERSALVGLKTTSYAENVVALAAAKSQGADEALFANTAGLLCEGSGSNVFVVVDGNVLTPSLSGGALGGVTRALVLEWARAAGVNIRETDIPLGVLAEVDEVFLTSSIRDVMPVTRISADPTTGVAARDLPVGGVTRDIQQLFVDQGRTEMDP